MKLHLYDTDARELREFEPLDPPNVGLYTCGPTVYDYAHIGNLRTYLFEDVLRRVLMFNGYEVKHVMNITDVGHLVTDGDIGEDRMMRGARREDMSAWELAEKYTEAFKRDLDRLNIWEPTVWCRATDHIEAQIDLVRCIESNGYTYETADGIYLDTSKISDYGHLARIDVEGLEPGVRVKMGEKRNPTDFALWKFSPEEEQRQMEWDSPWGVGFPGWHIECSAMSIEYLGPFFDIHCGGEDHINVHHPNEIAQTQACYETRLANFWLHGYFLQIKEARMGKSVGNFITVQDLVDRGYDPLAYRFMCLGANYRSRLSFSWEALDSAETALNRLRQHFFEWEGEGGQVDGGYEKRFLEQVNDDLNTPRGLAVAWDLVKSDLPDAVKRATMLRFDEVLGLRLDAWSPEEIEVPEKVQALVDEREEARETRDWEKADALRDRIREEGFEVKDTPEGPELERRE